MSIKKQYTKEFKVDAVKYHMSHKDLSVSKSANNLGVGKSTLAKWITEFKNTKDIHVRGSGNYMNDDAKELARVRKELKDTKDALYVLKKAMGILANDEQKQNISP